MLTDKFRNILQEYQRKRWFPAEYPDPFGEMIDYVSEGMITDLMDHWKKTGSFFHLSVAKFLNDILPSIQFGDVLAEYRSFYNKSLTEKRILPQFAFYYMRSLDEPQSQDLWREFRDWTESARTVSEEWFQLLFQFEKRSSELIQAYAKATSTDRFQEWKQILNSGTELFQWKLRKFFAGSGLFEWTRFLRFRSTDSAADWNDFAAFARSVSDLSGLKHTPQLRRDLEQEASHFLFPFAPPARVMLLHGSAAGPLDMLRFMIDFGRGCFYRGMNPHLPVEQRWNGDASLPWFWGFLFSHVLVSPEMLSRLVTREPQQLASQLELALEFWYRQDLALAVYRAGIEPDLKNAKDLYVSIFESPFALIQTPASLYLYDLERAAESSLRCAGHQAVLQVLERLRSLYGYEWMFSPKFSSRCRDYWWEGFNLKLSDVVRDFMS